MDMFDDSDQDKNNQNNQLQQIPEKKKWVPRKSKQDADNNQIKQNGQLNELQKQQKPKRTKPRRKRQQKKKPTTQVKVHKQQITIPLMIKFHSNLSTNEEFEQPLEQFVNQVYSNMQPINKIFQSFNQQDDEGNIQYKLKLINPTDDRITHLATQMKYRIKEGDGEAYYRIGVEDNGRPMGLCQEDMFQSLKTICRLARKLQTDVTVLRVSEGIKGLIVQLMVRKAQRQGVKLEIRLLLFGECGSGKSTLLGVLQSGEKDNGKGYARTKIFTHKHELMSGTTMTISHHVIGFDSKGRLYNQNSMMSSESWLDNANKLLSFIDVGGHKKAQKQIVSSLCSFFPQYALWVISAQKKNQTFSFSNLQLAKIFNLPLLVVITHIDLVSHDEQMETIYSIKKILKQFYPDKTACIVNQMQHAVLFSRITSSEAVIPLFLVSTVTGQNLQLLTNFFNLLPSTSQLRNNQDLHTQFLISDKYVVQNKTILAGTVIKGNIKRGQILHLGPDLKGSFRAVQVLSIQCMRVPVKLAKCGQVCTVALKLLNYAKQWLQKQPNAIRRGMVLVQSKSNPKATYQFLAELTTYGKEEVTITSKYQPVVNTLTTRQICSIIQLEKQKKEQVPMLLKSKKSKSIDTNKHRKFISRSSGNLALNCNSPYLSKQKLVASMKKSVDLTNQSDEYYEEQKVLKLESLSPIQQTGKIVKKKKQVNQIKFNDKNSTLLRLRFKYCPEYITVGQKIVINDMKLIGKVKEIFY